MSPQTLLGLWGGGRDLRPLSGAGVGQGVGTTRPSFHADETQHLAGVHFLDPEPRKWLG